MTLIHGHVGGKYRVLSSDLPFALKRRLNALGMTRYSRLEILHQKKNGTAVILLRGSRFAIGKGITARIEVEEVGDA